MPVLYRVRVSFQNTWGFCPKTRRQQRQHSFRIEHLSQVRHDQWRSLAESIACTSKSCSKENKHVGLTEIINQQNYPEKTFCIAYVPTHSTLQTRAYCMSVPPTAKYVPVWSKHTDWTCKKSILYREAQNLTHNIVYTQECALLTYIHYSGYKCSRLFNIACMHVQRGCYYLVPR